MAATQTQPAFPLSTPVDPLPLPKVVTSSEVEHQPYRQINIDMVAAEANVSSTFAHKTPVWTYNGSYPGPTIEVRRDEVVHVRWRNAIEGPYPIKAVIADTPANDTDPIPENEPGLSGKTGPADNYAAGLPAWTVVHLHGARVDADSDGWAENAMLKGLEKTAVYDNRQRSCMLWYHDHAMDITRLNVHTGLAGLYFIRDKYDDEVIESVRRARPHGHHGVRPRDVTPHTAVKDVVEIPLLLQDRNFDTDNQEADGVITGQFVHKVETGTPEFFGPFNLVNGVYFPYAEIAPVVYRIRVINGSNSRFYRLRLVDGAGKTVPFQVIGTDAGLLGAPVSSESRDLWVAPAERFDLIFDFRAYAKQTLTLMNVAPAPVGDSSEQIDPANNDPADRNTQPKVMEFRVGAPVESARAWAAPSPLSDYRAFDHGKSKHGHQPFLLGLAEHDGMVFLQDLRPEAPKYDHPVYPDTVDLPFKSGNPPTHDIVTYVVSSQAFSDAVDRVVMYETGMNADEPKEVYYEIWRVINLSPDAHPLHVHLTEMQVVARDRYTSRDENGDPLGTVTFDGPLPLEWQDIGWKDTVRINRNEMVTLALRFDGITGRFMVHCHLLDHEDKQMMRPYVVRPAAIPMPGMDGMVSGHHM